MALLKTKLIKVCFKNVSHILIKLLIQITWTLVYAYCDLFIIIVLYTPYLLDLVYKTRVLLYHTSSICHCSLTIFSLLSEQCFKLIMSNLHVSETLLSLYYVSLTACDYINIISQALNNIHIIICLGYFPKTINDKIDQWLLYEKLLLKDGPVFFVNVLVCWYSQQ